MEHKGYLGSAEFDAEANVFHGEVLGIRDVVTFQGRSVHELRKAFESSVDDYLDFCKKRREHPDKPFSGKFVLRVDPELHRQLSLAARTSKTSLNAWIAEQLRVAIEAPAERQVLRRRPVAKKTRTAVVRRRAGRTGSKRRRQRR